MVDPGKHHRRSIRLKGYDYTQPGAYYVTIVAQGRECVFGEVVDGAMRLNDAGRMVERWWMELGNKYPHVIPDTYIVMPNHFHGIAIITDGPGAGGDVVGADLRVCPTKGAHAGAPLPPGAGGDVVGADLCVCPAKGAHAGGDAVGADLCVCPAKGAHTGKGAHAGTPLPEMVQWFKTMTANEYIRGVKTLGWPPFPGRLWQRNYYEHIVRSDASLNRIRQYIAANPAQWGDDDENPEKVAR